MAIYVVMEPPLGSARSATERAVLVRDGFSLLAFLVPPLWLLWHRLWIEAALTFAIALALTALAEVAGFGVTGSLLSFLVSLYVGLEGSALRLAALRRRGWREWGVVEGRNMGEAEIRYLTEAEPAEVEKAVLPFADTSRQQPPATPARQQGPALGLFHYPGKA
ncbi:DUF2628 domain-containing protein [Pseudaminobacter soli (ex Li et al. 2025)]|uniref:DUF2628 domain-containing protein n=1 Tax=Pseudaminobacter soli (ex Li et al. 2025) TaxID=1295366 RepID=A0A2P7SI56_9HYPH|nr:DUF2628 domain-containing protein [Mesorhizobium soli]PSJ62157.1 DUF2628 domain-containing protein [Mesorhizobium soli]